MKNDLRRGMPERASSFHGVMQDDSIESQPECCD
ncbi:hypothetical protein QO004_002959 [Rhizobium mesoamericanum]|nr:hypothetical protein [Rhizobium mesoamericanum]